MKNNVTGMHRQEFDDLVCSKYGMIKKLLAKYKLSTENEEDVVQEIMTVILASIHTLRDPHKIDAWISSITTACINKFWRKEAKWGNLLPLEDVGEFPLAYHEMRDLCT